MPQVKGQTKGRAAPKGGAKSGGGAKKPTPARDAVVKQTADASSIIMGIFFVVAILVGLAAWMGQSLSVVEERVNLVADGAAKTVGLGVKTIRVYEASPEQEKRIRANLGIDVGDSMFRADPETLKDRLTRLKGFGEVQVHRFWPGQISVFVTPLETAVLFREDDDSELTPVDPLGREVVTARLEGDFHIVEGQGALDATPDLLADLNPFPTLDSRLHHAERISGRRWDLVMTSGVRVRLPAGEDRRRALEVLAALQRETGILDRHIEVIDLRDPARVYVRRSQLAASLNTNGGAG